jgi:hypothetical protein
MPERVIERGFLGLYPLAAWRRFAVGHIDRKGRIYHCYQGEAVNGYATMENAIDYAAKEGFSVFEITPFWARKVYPDNEGLEKMRAMFNMV